MSDHPYLDEYEQGYEDGYKAGYEAALKTARPKVLDIVQANVFELGEMWATQRKVRELFDKLEVFVK